MTSVSGNSVMLVAPAYAQGTGARDVALFDTMGTELARGTVSYDAPDQDSSVSYLLFLIALPLLMLWYDVSKAYGFAADTRRAIIDHVARDGMSLDELRLLLAELGQSPPGIPGLARTMMAFMLLLIVVIALFYMLTSGVSEVPDVVDKTVTVLTTALTTVVAFYFGARTATVAATSAVQNLPTTGASSQRPVAGQRTLTFRPTRGRVGSDMTIAGSGFGTQRGDVKFGTQKAAAIKHWSSVLITVEVPAGLNTGDKVAIEVIPLGGAQAISSTPNVFEVT